MFEGMQGCARLSVLQGKYALTRVSICTGMCKRSPRTGMLGVSTWWRCLIRTPPAVGNRQGLGKSGGVHPAAAVPGGSPAGVLSDWSQVAGSCTYLQGLPGR